MFSGNLVPYLEDFVFDDPFFSGQLHHHRQRHTTWKHFVPLHGFESKDIKIEPSVTEDNHNQIRVHAKCDRGEDDYCETKKTVIIPDDVDIETVRHFVSKDGICFQGNYKQTHMSINNPFPLQRQDNWNSIWSEMERMNQTMNRMMHSDSVKLPRTEFEQDPNAEKGKWKVHMNIGRGFNTNDLKVRHKDNMLYVDAHKEIGSETGKSIRTLHEAVSIPEGVEQENLKCSIRGNHLYIEAPAVKIGTAEIKNGDGSKPIPIEIATNSQQSMQTN